MALKTKAQYVESLMDGRENFWNGERIDDITTHPRFRVPIEVAAGDYDYDNLQRRDIITYRTEEGDLAHRVYQVPRSAEDLTKRMELLRNMSIVGGVTGVFMALLQIVDPLRKVNPQFAENIERMYRFARDNDLRAAEVITDAKGDRSRKAHEQDDPDLYLRIVERNKDGIVVRGAKLHISAAALVHELVVMPTKAMGEDERDYAVAFSIPVNSKGVKIINRSFAAPELNPFDYPASAHHSMPEGFIVFDDVFVPWERVFLAGEWQLSGAFAGALGLWERTGGLVDAVESSQVMVGLAQLVSEQQGKGKKPEAQNGIAELICYAEMLRMGLDDACRNFERTPSGMVHPNTLAINVAKYHYANNFHSMVKILHDLAGGLTLTLPEEGDLRSNEVGPYLRKYLHTTKDADVETRMRVYNLIRDISADSFGGWKQVVALQAGGGLLAQRVMMHRSYDMDAARAKALALAGVRPTSGE
ncbi:4-hydroxyphenylacetate 3-hydroxylase N-terminal domain-containing protein [Parvibaculum sp.]|uniref:4-hydroxyphenylacetate 3-hydroxylase N-terminal domain-containing protein n=1 Tax=Parvibaculum sp. TaxID=2024848 RepID=UPI00320DEBB6